MSVPGNSKTVKVDVESVDLISRFEVWTSFTERHSRRTSFGLVLSELNPAMPGRRGIVNKSRVVHYQGGIAASDWFVSSHVLCIHPQFVTSWTMYKGMVKR